MLSHDLLKDKNRCVDILITAGNYLKNAELSKKIKNVTKSLGDKDNWAEIVNNVGMELYNKIKGGEL
jgi:hypothetical protein